MSSIPDLLFSCFAAVVGAMAARGWAVRAARRQFRSCGDEPPTDRRLLGTWLSDADATVAEWRERRPMTDEQTDKLRSVFGKLRVIWQPNALSTEFEGQIENCPYRLIAVDDTSAVVRVWNSFHKRDEFVTIQFVDQDTYWLYAAGGPLREYFRRVG